MNPNDPQSPQSSSQPRPVAYDAQGRPLYAHPPQQPATPEATSEPALEQQPAASSDQPPQQQVVYVTRPHEPVKPHISDEVRRKHQESTEKYPMLNLSEGEYVIAAIKRHPIGLFAIWGTTLLLIVLVGFIIPIILLAQGALSTFGITTDFDSGFLGVAFVGGLCLLFLLGGYISAHVYNANRFYLTNESVTQHLQHSLFSRREQTISLGGIEDASYHQQGIIEHFFNYGSLRLSTEGDETTYRFSYVSDPRRQVAILNDAVESFKMGRPVGYRGGKD